MCWEGVGSDIKVTKEERGFESGLDSNPGSVTYYLNELGQSPSLLQVSISLSLGCKHKISTFHGCYEDYIHVKTVRCGTNVSCCF